MKYLLTLLYVAATTALLAQKNLDPARGHYKNLEAYAAKPAAPGLAADQQKFPFDAASAERRLSLKPVFLTDVKPDDFKIPDPPANSSEKTRAELNYLLGLQAQRTQLDVDASLVMAGVFYNPRTTQADSNYNAYRKNLFFIGRSIGTWFHPDTLPQTANLMAKVWQDASFFIWSLKYKHLRVRPYVLEPALKNLEETNWAAYPSGHAANSYINAYIYSELAPAFADVFLKDAYDMAHSREIIGVHYPTDSEASRILARQLVNKLMANAAFQKEFELVKKEWATKAKESFAKPSAAVIGGNTQGSSCSKTCN